MIKEIIFDFDFNLKYHGPGKFVSGLNKLDVGMTKQEVISVLGRNYKKWGIEATPEGNIERWAFQDNNILYYSPDEQVIVSFLNDRLIEWHKEVLPQTPTNNED